MTMQVPQVECFSSSACWPLSVTLILLAVSRSRVNLGAVLFMWPLDRWCVRGFDIVF